MNFLSHDFILPADSTPLARLASALPDLWAVLHRKPLPLVVLRTLEASRHSEARQLARGVRSHLAADTAFHGHPSFGQRVAWLAPQLEPLWKGLRHGHLAAHVLVEMILDAWLIERQPMRVDDYYACFSPSRIRLAARWSASDKLMENEVISVIERFSNSQFLRDYATPEGLLDRFVRLMMHTPFASGTHPDFDGLVRVTRDAISALEAGSEALLEHARKASDEALERAAQKHARE